MVVRDPPTVAVDFLWLSGCQVQPTRRGARCLSCLVRGYNKVWRSPVRNSECPVKTARCCKADWLTALYSYIHMYIVVHSTPRYGCFSDFTCSCGVDVELMAERCCPLCEKEAFIHVPWHGRTQTPPFTSALQAISDSFR